MAQIVRSKVGPVIAGDGTYPEGRGGRTGELIVADAHGRYTETTYRAGVYSISSAGAGQAQVAANLFSTAIATFQPIVGIYNPTPNTINVAILKAWIGIVGQAASATVPGGFMWVVASNQNITQAGTTPINNFTLQAKGSRVVGLVNQALTGATGSLSVLRPIASMNPNVTNAATPTILGLSIFEDQVEGSIIVPPSGFVGIANGITGTTNTFQGGITWEEIPL